MNGGGDAGDVSDPDGSGQSRGQCLVVGNIALDSVTFRSLGITIWSGDVSIRVLIAVPLTLVATHESQVQGSTELAELDAAQSDGQPQSAAQQQRNEH